MEVRNAESALDMKRALWRDPAIRRLFRRIAVLSDPLKPQSQSSKTAPANISEKPISR
jgi:hypothetical protein